jgi:hypothetical protein
MDNGYWIRLYRKIRETAIWANDEPFDYRSAWIDLLMEANVKPNVIVYKGQTIRIKRGEYYTSIRKLSLRWHWSKDKVNRFLKMLIKLDMVRKHKDIRCATLLTIVNYDDYQYATDSNKDRHKDRPKDGDKDTGKSLYKKDIESKERKEGDPPTSDEGVAAEEDVGMTDEEWENWGEVFTP